MKEHDLDDVNRYRLKPLSLGLRTLSRMHGFMPFWSPDGVAHPWIQCIADPYGADDRITVMAAGFVSNNPVVFGSPTAWAMRGAYHLAEAYRP